MHIASVPSARSDVLELPAVIYTYEKHAWMSKPRVGAGSQTVVCRADVCRVHTALTIADPLYAFGMHILR